MISSTLLVLLLIPTVLGWGKEGHYVVCKITQEYLSEDALFAVKQLLPDSAHGDLAALCSWPDEIRFHYQYCRDCHDSDGRKHKGTFVLVTFCWGCTSAPTCWFYRRPRWKLDNSSLAIQRNITDIWSNDVSIWEHCAHNYTACPYWYASESVSLACKFAYRNTTPGSTLKDEYFLSRLPIMEKRLAQGGVRLAAILNRIFTSKTGIAQA
ncbi:hypothetical protein KIW84_064778 [Lathyrus oleraceus]|uniref:Aspergillus nuclease S1 n=1 Tax=Pisum sativum TaxID=3888 RepID=A0A9D4WCP7_PEA|nr:hypothetical protein KIW84_064778 [Pisum sativum]